MAKTLFTSKGTSLQLGRELGKGGEGTVFETPSLSNQVVKLYHQLPDAKKQAKLTFMASTADQQLLNYVAWPQETIHSSRGGPVAGFLMPQVVGKDPVHMVYSPAHRRQDRPKAAWDFLLYVARNTAAAFDALHTHGHVLGDVNQGNVLVGGDSKVVLIDSDSFQVNAKGVLHLCEVGVAHFTPPELQGLSSFQGFTRTANHDNFGLALLIFHLLFGGRHPYSGVPLKSGVGDALETDIKGFRYAYSRDAASRGISPPPRSIPLSMVPDSMEAMFQMAFTEKGALGGRPTAKQWEHALDGVRTRLKKCGASSVHVYPDHLPKCPWCALEQQGVVYFIDLGGTYTTTETGFNLTQVWAQIEAIPAPPPVSEPNIGGISVVPTPLPANVPGGGTAVFFRVVVVCVAFACVAAMPQAWILFALGAWFAWAAAGSSGSNERAEEWKKRKAAEESARNLFNSILGRMKNEAGPEGFHQKKAELKKLKDELQAIPAQEAQELSKLHSTAQERQKQKFLERFFIDTADIPGVGPARKAALRSFGIETAADVSRNQVMQVRGFGESLTRAVTDWKASVERRFVFNPANAVSEADKNTVRAKFGARKSAISASLRGGAAELQRFKQMAASRASSLQPQLDQAAKLLAQAQSDLTLL
ncbi:helix-hairpin-helix domain-containing protein [Rhodoferax sp. U11-2br]|uniref:helix-hairpin-helix domain-containing protein n=1 Tax=Rhodoferax sp. U11-2br TaxID=2838878 RepID=UPI001BEAD0A7|nr:helix-hairpin-helix domain-containing protein [Rhodoferax sp. U11-2br]MBT3067951.1 helix-hairpin-helix domain-containing protein [Rhodoferax sp. U11-2br]